MGTDVLQLVTAVLGSLGFSLIFNVRGKTLFWGALGGLLAWGSYLFFVERGTRMWWAICFPVCSLRFMRKSAPDGSEPRQRCF